MAKLLKTRLGIPRSYAIITERLLFIMTLFLLGAFSVESNPVPKSEPTVSSSGGVVVQPSKPADRLQLPKPSQLTFNVGRCKADVSMESITCKNLRHRGDLPRKEPYFDGILQAKFINISSELSGDIRLSDFKALFPKLISLTISESKGSAASLINLEKTGASRQYIQSMDSLIPKSLLQDPHFARRFNLNSGTSRGASREKTKSVSESPGRGERALVSQETLGDASNNAILATTLSPTTSPDSEKSTQLSKNSGESLGSKDYLHDNGINSVEETNDIFSPTPKEKEAEVNEDGDNLQNDDAIEENVVVIPPPEPPHKLRKFVWESIRILNLSSNGLTSDALPDFLGNIFPNLEEIYLENNSLKTLEKVRQADWTSLQKIDISGNPLDCTNLDWVENPSISLLQPNETLCEHPPHQNKAKPILKVVHLLKKVRKECLVNCSCEIAYIWEQNHDYFSKTVVNCSNRGFLDFPSAVLLPNPTDTLDLRNNNITSMQTFVDDPEYLKRNVKTLHLDDNKISSINILEGSEWFYNQFQVFTIQRNDLTEVDVHILENAFRSQGTRYILRVDLSQNSFNCDCSTVSSLKVWLLRYADQIAHAEDVRCASTNEQIRQMRMEEWCQVDNGQQYIDVLDIVSIVLAFLIVIVVAKVYYDYWNFKTKGKLPWLVGKM